MNGKTISEREPTGEPVNLRELLTDGTTPVTIGDANGAWYTVLSSRPNLEDEQHIDFEVQYPDGGLGARTGVPLDQDVQVFE